jgi:hypothetical protein
MSKSSLMRRYVQEGVAREASMYPEQTERVLAAAKSLEASLVSSSTDFPTIR